MYIRDDSIMTKKQTKESRDKSVLKTLRYFIVNLFKPEKDKNLMSKDKKLNGDKSVY